MSKKMQWCETTFKLSNGELITICHNIPDKIQAAFDNWIARTDEYTATSFCEYINQKRKDGKTNHFAYTVKEFEKLNGTSISKLRRDENSPIL